jgi:hypothetical protein
MAGKLLSDLTPKEPVQKQSPLLKSGTALNIAFISDAVLTTRGNPRIGNGGSSGCITILTPQLSATGIIFCKKCIK